VLRYAQCWEDADTLLQALDVRPGEVCLSIASGGENSLALLTRDPARVIAVDRSPGQIACLEVKVAGYRRLTHPELLELVGARPSTQRLDLYARVREALSPPARAYWDARGREVAAGIGSAGRFERYLALFRRVVLPLAHRRRVVDALFVPRTREARHRFYAGVWDTWRWRLLCRVFLSRAVMGRIGRDRSFFRYAEGDVAEPILAQVRHALTELDPSLNPYLQWIARGRFAMALPCALRAESFDPIRERLDRLEWRVSPVEAVLAEAADRSIDRFNLSDVFEYLSAEESRAVFAAVARTGRPGGRVAYWNMLVPRRRPADLASRLQTLEDLGRRLHRDARACFYSALWVDELA
jgi:S-adenosylmethionine-diacylglycerol 3-amino-3-carboxypropyl transferase